MNIWGNAWGGNWGDAWGKYEIALSVPRADEVAQTRKRQAGSIGDRQADEINARQSVVVGDRLGADSMPRGQYAQWDNRAAAAQISARAVGPYGMRQANTQRSTR